MSSKDVLEDVKLHIGKKPAVFHGKDFDCFRSRVELRENVRKLSEAQGFEPFWVYDYLHDSLVKPQWLRSYPVDFCSDWDCCLFVPLENEYVWDDVIKFLLKHFEKFGTNRKFSIEQLANMIKSTYTERTKKDCQNDALSIIQEFSQQRDSIMFRNMLECYKVTLQSHPKPFKDELKKMGYRPPLSTMEFSDEMLDLLEETYLLIKQVKEAGLQETKGNKEKTAETPL